MATTLLDKPEASISEAAEGETAPTEYRWTVDDFMKAAEAGAFGHDRRLELIQGRIWKHLGQGPRHSTLASIIADMLREAAGKEFSVREEKPVRIAADSQPLPDVMVLKGRQTDYNDRQPSPEDVQLLIEISVTTIDYDLGEKALLYAGAGILDYWVVAGEAQAIIVHRQPTPNGYQQVKRLAGTETLSPLAMPEVVWTVDALLGKRDEA